MNKNQTGKYFKYAIGEIILVVIGILIALQINNWNTKKQEHIELKGYLNNISKNIKTDLSNLDTLLLFRNSVKLSAIEFLKIADSPSVSSEDIKNYFKNHSNYLAIFDTYFRADLSGFEALKNSGYIGKLHNSNIETLLFKYYETIDVIAAEESSVNNFVEEMENEMFKDNVVRALLKMLRRGFNEPNDIDKTHKIFQHHAFAGANFRMSNLKTLFEKYNQLQKTGSKLIHQIELYK
ncbi:DUF6090 family protein [Lacinutrix iliipiscaria]|uniref:DUF6090 family protein n=1 Tax=Lacinutrix iliipiscaria TaxID=1230532 RepID=A0ABW5WMC8_9FLAO